MLAKKMPFVKVPAQLFSSGIWAQLTATARTLYPVLLSFSDGNYGPVWPSTSRLMILTGFKQKSSIRRGREELVRVGLVKVIPGSGRTNTHYYFTHPWVGRGAPSEWSREDPLDPNESALGRACGAVPGVDSGPGEYNKIQISINNNTRPAFQEDEVDEFLLQRFGPLEYKRAVQECRLGDLNVNRANLERILYANQAATPGTVRDWSSLKRYLEEKISRGSLNLIEQALLSDTDDLMVFRADLPEHLRSLLVKTGFQLIFEPESVSCQAHEAMEPAKRL
ncbi:MAG: helix-turn-helix domain-containing protein [Leptospiraceae bacterium]|nr:helix-turn-helix domain-containing protein [Leptospiraceae bacterium]